MRRLLPAIAVLAALTATGMAGCDKSTPVAGPPPVTATSSNASPTPVVKATESEAEWCALAIRIATDSGVMVDKHYVSPLKETLDQFKAIVNASLAARDQLLAGAPAEIRPALLIGLQYFQMLKDNNFAATTPPAGFYAANKTVNDYQVSECGVVFDP